jgi:uncharacterized pyridoxal phosphate-containing UPF0001 family protein
LINAIDAIIPAEFAGTIQRRIVRLTADRQDLIASLKQLSLILEIDPKEDVIIRE